MKLPTPLAVQLLEDILNPKVMGLDGYRTDVRDAVAAFQRMAAVADYETAIVALTSTLKPDERKFNVFETKLLKLCYDTTKSDLLAHAVDAIMALTDGQNVASKDRLAAAAIINEFYGEKHLIEDGVLTDKLIVNLIGDGK